MPKGPTKVVLMEETRGLTEEEEVELLASGTGLFQRLPDTKGEKWAVAYFSDDVWDMVITCSKKSPR